MDVAGAALPVVTALTGVAFFATDLVVVVLRVVDVAAGAAAGRAADVVRPALLVAGVLVAAMAYRPLPG